MTQWLVVKNWREHQHYGKRRPPWIKLHRAMLEDYTVASLPDAAKAHLLGIWMLAAADDGRVPDDAAWIAKRINATIRVDVEALVSLGLLGREQDASNPLAPDASEVLCSEETEKRREETEERQRQTEDFEKAWKTYPRKPNNPKAGAFRAWSARVKEGTDPAVMLAGVVKYAAFVRAEGTDPKYIKMAATFFGPDRHWESDYTSSKPKPAGTVYAPYHEKYKAPPREPIDERVKALVGTIGKAVA